MGLRAMLLLLASLLAHGASGAPSALDFLPDGFLSSEHLLLFDRAVHQARDLAACARPQDRRGAAHRTSERPMGLRLVLPPHLRRVPVETGFRRHLDLAAQLPFPFDLRLRSTALPADSQCAIRQAMLLGGQLPHERARRSEAATAICTSVRPVSAAINALMPATVARISSSVNTACMAVWCDALQWLDTALVQRFVHGFPIVGDIPDSGVYRPIEPVPLAVHERRLAVFRATAPNWNRRLHSRLAARRWADEAATAADRAVAAKSATERAKSLIVGPYTSVAAVQAAVAHLSPGAPYRDMLPRVMTRFGVPQKGSIRAIDDGRSNDANAASRLHETITTPAFFYPAVVARAAADAAASVGHPIPAMVVLLMDLTAAYRTIPTSQPWFTTVGFYNPDASRVEYYWLPGHNCAPRPPLVAPSLSFPSLPCSSARHASQASEPPLSSLLSPRPSRPRLRGGQLQSVP